jgi:WD40 repeat protein
MLLSVPSFAAATEPTVIPPEQWQSQFTCWSPDGRLIAMEWTDDNKPFIWGFPHRAGEQTVIVDASTFKVLRIIPKSLVDLKWSPDGALLAGLAAPVHPKEELSQYSGILQIYEVSTGKEVKQLSFSTGFSWSAKGRSILSVAPYGAQILDFDSGSDLTLHQSGGFKRRPVWSQDGRYVACSKGMKAKDLWTTTIGIWDASTGKSVHELQLHESVGDYGWSPDSQSFVVSDATEIRVLESKTLKLTETFESQNPEDVMSANIADAFPPPLRCPMKFGWSPDGRMFAYLYFDSLHILDWHNRQSIENLHVAKGYGASWIWSPDGKYIAVSDYLREIAIFDVTRHSCVGHKPFRGFENILWKPDANAILVRGEGRSTLLPFNSSGKGDAFPGIEPGNPWASAGRPSTLDQCFTQLDKALSVERRSSISAIVREQDVTRYSAIEVTIAFEHWDTRMLSNIMRQKHPALTDDDIITIVARGYWRHLHHLPNADEY